MNVFRLQEHEHPARPDHDVRRQSVLDSRDHLLGYVANLFVDEDERHVRFIDVVPENWLGRPRERHHHLVPIEALIPRAESIRRDSYAEVELRGRAASGQRDRRELPDPPAFVRRPRF